MRTSGSAPALALALALAGACQDATASGPAYLCAGKPTIDDAGLPSCWDHDCPGDPGAAVCGSCRHHGADHECPPGFVCSCGLQCARGPRSYDGGVTCDPPDAGPGPDAQRYTWPVCDDRHRACDP